jgi:hypothetical protein
MALCGEVMQAVVHHPAPVIAAVEGIATAAGCQLVASCDLAVAAPGAKFCTPGVEIGLFCSTPAVALSRAIPRKPAMEMLLTGRMVPAAEALALGLVNRVADDARAAALNLAAQVASRSVQTVRLGKMGFLAQEGRPLAQAYSTAGQVMVENMLAADAAEGIGASWRSARRAERPLMQDDLRASGRRQPPPLTPLLFLERTPSSPTTPPSSTALRRPYRELRDRCVRCPRPDAAAPGKGDVGRGAPAQHPRHARSHITACRWPAAC